MKHKSKKLYIFPILISLLIFLLGFYISNNTNKISDIKIADTVKEPRILNNSGLYEFTEADTEKWKEDVLKREKFENERKEANRIFLEKCREGDSYNEDQRLYVLKEGYQFTLSLNYTVPKRYCNDSRPSEDLVFREEGLYSDSYGDTSQGVISLYSRGDRDLEYVNKDLSNEEPVRVGNWDVYSTHPGTYYFQDQDYIFIFSDQEIEDETDAGPILEMISTFKKQRYKDSY